MNVKGKRITIVALATIIVVLLLLTSSFGVLGIADNKLIASKATRSVANISNKHLAGMNNVLNSHYFPSGVTLRSLQNITSFLTIRNEKKYTSNAVESPTYAVTFTVSNKASGANWTLDIFTNLSLAIPDIPLYNSIYHQSYGIVFSSSSTSSAITASIPSGTYYYYAGPSSTLVGPYAITVYEAKSVSITFPTLHTASFSETGLASGSSWSVYGTSNSPDGKVTIISETSTSTTISTPAPNGYYEFGYGTGSLVIESYPFMVSDNNVSRQVSIPSVYEITFQESGLSAGLMWQIVGVGVTQNHYSFKNFFVATSRTGTMSVEVPNGAYYYEPIADNTSFVTSSYLYVNGNAETIPLAFSTFYRVVIKGTGYYPGVEWEVSAYSTNGAVSSVNYTRSSTLELELPTGSYTFLAGESGSNLLNGKFNVSGSNTSLTLDFPQTYRVNFSETGLGGGLEWGVTIYAEGNVVSFVNSTLSSSLSTYLPNGKYNYTVAEEAINSILSQTDQSVYSSSSFTVSSSQLNLTTTFPGLTPVTFSESNLYPGITWGVGIYSSSSQTGYSEVFFNISSVFSNVTVFLINGTFYYSLEEANSFLYSTSSTLNVAGVPKTIDYHFPSLYEVTLSIVGLRSSNIWSLTINEANYSLTYTNSSSFSTMNAFLPNATYNYTVATTSHLSTSASFSVKGKPLSVTISITPSFIVKFTESGLPVGTSWYVDLNGTYAFSSNSTIQFNEPNGTYSYSVVSSNYNAVPNNGTISVSGKDQNITIKFKPVQVTYSILFLESGLPSGTLWSVTMSNSTVYSKYNSLIIQEPNGTYTYQINASGYVPSPSAGIISIKGANETITVTFTVAIPAKSYGITFSETGLPQGTAWSISLTNSTYSGKLVGIISTVKQSVDVYGITYDSSNRYIYASGILYNSTSSTKYPGVILVISTLTNTIITTISVGSLPETSVYDPYDGYLYVANSLSNNVSVINTATQSVIDTIAVGTEPVGIAYSSTNNYIYVANGASGTVSVINSTTNTVISTISLNSSGETLAGVVFDPSNGNVYVGGFNSVSKLDTVFVINSATNVVVSQITGAAYFGIFDPSNGYLYFTDNALNSVLVVDGSTNKVVTTIGLPSRSSPVGIAYDSYDKNVYVAEQNLSSLAVISAVTNTVIANLDVSGSPLFPVYSPVNHDIYLSNHLLGGIQVITSYGGVNTIKSSTSNAIQFSEPNGSYSFSIGSISGYTINPQSGSFIVNGSSLSENILFSQVTGYEVTFSQTGLRAGSSWSVTLAGRTIASTSPSIIFTETNGSYSFEVSNVSGYLVSPTFGTVIVSGSSVTKTITFSELYSVNFIESGLSLGTNWSVDLNGAVKSSDGTNIIFAELNGTYSFSISSPTNLTISPASGTVTVDGAGINQTVHFVSQVKILYLSGTISPINATLYINQQAVSTVDGVFNVTVHPGTYEIEVTSAGYQPYYKNITVLPNQTEVSPLSINLEKITPPTPFPLIYVMIIVVVIVAVIGATSFVILRGRQKQDSKRKS